MTLRFKQRRKDMKNKSLLVMMLLFPAVAIQAQSNEQKMNDTQKAQAAKADVYIINSQKKITDSAAITFKDSTAATKPSKKKCCLKRKKKAPVTEPSLH